MEEASDRPWRASLAEHAQVGHLATGPAARCRLDPAGPCSLAGRTWLAGNHLASDAGADEIDAIDRGGCLAWRAGNA
jgi:hypothetical protein